MSLKQTLNKDDKFDKEELISISKVETKEDYVLMNYLEQRMILIKGADFVKRSQPKIQYIMSMLLDEDVENLYDFYSGSFDEYMKICGNDYDQIGSFNLTFAILIHLAVKIIRRCS